MWLVDFGVFERNLVVFGVFQLYFWFYTRKIAFYPQKQPNMVQLSRNPLNSVMIRNYWLASCSSEVGCSCRTSVKIAKYHQSFLVGFGFDSFTEKCVLPIFFSNCWVLSYFPNFPRACLMVGWLAICTCNCWWKSIECRGSQLLLLTIWAWNSRNLFFRW